MRLGGCDGGVRDEREIVAEEGAADDDGRYQGEAHAGVGGQSAREGDQGHDRAYAGANGQGNEAGGQEQPGEEKLGGQDGQGEVHRGIDGADGLGGAGKGPGQHENPNHQQDVLIARPFRKNGDELPQWQFPATWACNCFRGVARSCSCGVVRSCSRGVARSCSCGVARDADSVNGGYQEGGRYGNFIEIADSQRGHQIDQQENQQRS